MNEVGADTFSSIISEYGPAGLIGILLFIEFLIIKHWLKKTDSKSQQLLFTKEIKSIHNILKALLIICCCSLLVVWVVNNLHHEKNQFIGDLSGLRNGLIADVLVHGYPTWEQRSYFANNKFSIRFKIISDEEISNNERVQIGISPTGEVEDDGAMFSFNFDQQYYNKCILLRYIEQQRCIILSAEGFEDKYLHEIEEIFPDRLSAITYDEVVLNGAKPHSYSLYNIFLPSVAYAQNIEDISVLLNALESDSLLTRREARLKLAEIGPEISPRMEDLLLDPESSFRLTLGAIAVLRLMNGLNAIDLKPQTIDRIIELTMHPDDTIRQYAVRFLIIHRSCCDIETKLQQQFELSNQLSAIDQDYIARAYFEVLYNIAIDDLYAYNSCDNDPYYVDKAIEILSLAWNLREHALPINKIHYIKALYGWGLALHTKSVNCNEEEPNNHDLINEAICIFQLFISEYEADQYRSLYNYPNHYERALHYIDNPNGNVFLHDFSLKNQLLLYACKTRTLTDYGYLLLQYIAFG